MSQMYLYAMRENKILMKISEFTVLSKVSISKGGILGCNNRPIIISQPIHMLWVLKRDGSFEHPKTCLS